MASSRFHSKVLADIGGIPMVIRTAKVASLVDDVVIATDSEEVVSVCLRFNFKSVLTSKDHKSGSDRVNEACSILCLNHNDIVLNLQADEPFIEKDVLKKVINRAKNLIGNNGTNTDVIAVSRYKSVDFEVANSRDIVKVVLDGSSNAIYFSRSLIPFDRENVLDRYNAHIGIYAFSVSSLKQFCSLPPIEHGVDIENIEKLEQLRAIYYAKKIAMVEVQTKSFGIDTKEDLQKAKEIFL